MTELILSLLPFLAQVESANDPNAIGDNGRAVGILQIHKCVVDDVNRILGADVFKYSDRKNQGLSWRIAGIYLGHYGRHYERLTGKSATHEVLARIWNGGPDGWKKPSTLKYWKRVQKELKK